MTSEKSIKDEKTSVKDYSSYFENIIGYQSVKENLYHILDCMVNKQRYLKVGAHTPKGLMLSGRPGVGKTVLANDFIKACGRNFVPLKLDENNDLLIRKIEYVFKKAKENQPSIILLDDIDKFGGNNDINNVFLGIQSLVDSVKDDDVFIVATLNDSDALPESLKRAGRFDYSVKVCRPSSKDQELFIANYMKEKPFDKSIQITDVSPLVPESSCADIISFFNKVSIQAGYKEDNAITIQDIVEVSNRIDDLDDSEGVVDLTQEEKQFSQEVAYHEVGHLLMAEACVPGSTGFVSILGSNNERSYCATDSTKVNRRPYIIIIGLGGKASYEMKYGKIASGCSGDIERVRRIIQNGILDNATSGFSYLDNAYGRNPQREQLEERINGVVTFQFEESFRKATEIVALNRGFVEEAVKLLTQKGYLLKSDIKSLEAAHPINRTPVVGV